MKKFIVISTLFLMSLAGTAFAGDLNALGTPSIVNLSASVEGKYFSNGSNQDATDFVIYTGHQQGGYVYGTGSFTTAIFRLASSDPFVTTDLPDLPGSWDATTAFPSWGEI